MSLDAFLADPALRPKPAEWDSPFTYPRPADPPVVIFRADSDFASFGRLEPEARGEVWSTSMDPDGVTRANVWVLPSGPMCFGVDLREVVTA